MIYGGVLHVSALLGYECAPLWILNSSILGFNAIDILVVTLDLTYKNSEL